MEKSTVLVLQKVQFTGYSNNLSLTPLTQARCRSRTVCSPLSSRQVTPERTTATAPVVPAILLWRVKAKSDTQRACMSSKQKYSWTLFQLPHCLLKATNLHEKVFETSSIIKFSSHVQINLFFLCDVNRNSPFFYKTHLHTSRIQW